MLELRLFGTGQASYHGHFLEGFPGQQSALLLCYLLLNPQPHHRERLGVVFWENASTQVCRKNLSQALWRLRQMFLGVEANLDDYLAIGKESIAFNPVGSLWLDLEAFETAITRYHHIPGYKLTTEQVIELEQAVTCYTGDLLEGVYEDWCFYDRERFRLMYLETLGKLMMVHEVNGAYEQGIIYGERILATDNTRERVHQQLMRLHALANNRSAAITQYKRCVQILREELDASPMEETSQLYHQILANQLTPLAEFGHNGNALSPLIRSDESMKSLAKLSLHRLTQLQAVIEEAALELQQLERLIKKALLDS